MPSQLWTDEDARCGWALSSALRDSEMPSQLGGQASASGSSTSGATAVERAAGAVGRHAGSTRSRAWGRRRWGGTEPREKRGWRRGAAGGRARAGDMESPAESPEPDILN
jgi:hypothetical protein